MDTKCDCNIYIYIYIHFRGAQASELPINWQKFGQKIGEGIGSSRRERESHTSGWVREPPAMAAKLSGHEQQARPAVGQCGWMEQAVAR